MATPPSEHEEDSAEHLTRRVARGGAIVFVGSMIAKVASMGLQVLLSRVLGPAGMGLYALGRSVIQILHEFTPIGLQAGVVRFVPSFLSQRRFAELKGTLIASFGIAAATSITAAAAVFFGAQVLANDMFHKPELVPVLRIFAFALPFYVFSYVAARTARAFHSMGHDTWLSSIAQPTFTIVFSALAFALGYGVEGAAFAFLLATVLNAIFAAYVVLRLFPGLGERSLKASYDVRRLLNFSLPFLGVIMATYLVFHVDRIFLGMYRDAYEVGIYHAAATVANQASFALGAVNSSFSPLVARLYHDGRTEELGRLFRSATRWTLSIALPTSLAMILFAPQLLSLFGRSFAEGQTVLIMLVAASFVNAATGPVGMMLHQTDHQYAVGINNVTMAVLGIILNLWLIPPYGMLGAAAATATAVILLNIGKLFQVWYHLRIQPYDASTLKPLLAGGLSGAVTWMFLRVVPAWWTWMVALPAFLMLFCGIMLALRLEADDHLVYEAFLRKMARFRRAR